MTATGERNPEPTIPPLPRPIFFILRLLLRAEMAKKTKSDHKTGISLRDIYLMDTRFWSELGHGRTGTGVSPSLMFDDPRQLDPQLGPFWDHFLYPETIPKVGKVYCTSKQTIRFELTLVHQASLDPAGLIDQLQPTSATPITKHMLLRCDTLVGKFWKLSVRCPFRRDSPLPAQKLN